MTPCGEKKASHWVELGGTPRVLTTAGRAGQVALNGGLNSNALTGQL